LNSPAPAPASIRPTAPLRPLLLVSAAVIAAHLLILQVTTVNLHTPPSSISQPFITRTITLAPEKPAASEPAPTVPRKKPRAQPKVAAPVAEAVAPAAMTDAAASTHTVVDTAIPAAEVSATPAVPAAESAPETAVPAETVRPPAHTLPGSQRLKYTITGEVRSLTYHASAELLWQNDGNAYEARLEVGAFLLGSRVQTSTGRITAEGLAPKRFSDKVRSEVAAHFERDKGKVIFSANTPEVPLQPGAQDQLSIFVQLASLLAGEPERYPPGSAIEMQAVGAREADSWRFTVDGPELLHLPGGDQATVKLTRAPRQTYDLTVELWLAPALGYLPARIRLTQNNGDFIDQLWRTSEAP
jgi:hypothetical protein